MLNFNKSAFGAVLFHGLIHRIVPGLISRPAYPALRKNPEIFIGDFRQMRLWQNLRH
ncbi:hypothetical protein [Arenimonas sp. GDDSR-1]|uniref:hypothetical protein n=1 Tax=Arenimonas sp. GDDSR-1 TaxID=2950125 RepID=UPI002620D1BA|nr:hypothetical protein [Arenimonas sp. GDDSR-1]